MENEQVEKPVEDTKQEEQKPDKYPKNINSVLLDKEVAALVKKADEDALIKDGRKEIKLLHDDMVNVSETLEVRVNFKCEACGDVPMLPVKMCEECEMIYCGDPLRCLNGLKGCCNPDCPKNSEEFSTVKCGRIIRNAMSTFEFKNTEEEDGEPIGYERKCKQLVEDFRSKQRFCCMHEECEAHKEKFSKDELQTHLEKDCQKKTIECIICEKEYSRDTYHDESIHDCFKNVKEGILARKKENPKYLFKRTKLRIDDSIEIDGGNWCQVRHVPKGMKWFKARDMLEGTEEYGNSKNDDEEWSIKFDDANFNQFLFATGDFKKWMICGKEAITGEFYNNKFKMIQKSSKSDEAHHVRMYRGNGSRDHPYLGLADYHTKEAEENTLYMANGSRSRSKVLQHNDGANVYVRINPDYVYDKEKEEKAEQNYDDEDDY